MRGRGQLALRHASGAVPRIGNIEVERGKLHYLDAKAAADVRAALHDRRGRPGAAQVPGRRQAAWRAIVLEGTSMGLSQLQDMDDPYRFRLHAVNGRTVVDFDGTVVPPNTENLDGTLAIAGPDMSKLYPVVPTPFPWTPAVSARRQAVAHGTCGGTAISTASSGPATLPAA
jgi:hypothetical protein